MTNDLAHRFFERRRPARTWREQAARELRARFDAALIRAMVARPMRSYTKTLTGMPRAR